MTQLTRKCGEALDAGVSWEDLGEFYRHVMRRVDKSVLGFGSKVGVAEAPNQQWAKDPVYEWVATLNGKIATALARSAVQAELQGFKKDTMQQLDQMRQKRKDATTTQPTPGLPGGKTAVPGGLGPGGQLSKRQKRDAAQAAKAAGAGQAAKLAQEKAQAAAAKQAAVQAAAQAAAQPGALVPYVPPEPGKVPYKDLKASQAALTREMGPKDGKPPCWFHHKGPTGCFKKAEDCQGYH